MFFPLVSNILRFAHDVTRYLKGPPESELHNGNKIMAIRLTNPFLLMKKLVPPLNAGFGNRFFNY